MQNTIVLRLTGFSLDLPVRAACLPGAQAGTQIGDTELVEYNICNIEKEGINMAVRTRNDLARVMAPKMGMTHQESERYLKELIAEMTKALKNGECALTNHNAMRVKFPLR